ncbi:MAG: hypothetical protein H8K11_15600 [Nitrospira sp.]|nr:hypothetical protein [Nitrospira sp.]
MLLVRRIASALLGLVPLMLIGAGVVSVLREVQAHDPSMYSIQGEKHLADACMFAGAGCIGLFGCYRLWRANASGKWVLVPVAVSIFAVVFPNIERWPHGTPVGRASFSVLQRLSAVSGSATQLARERGEFVCDRSATLSASSLFARQGQALPYVIHCVSDATGPVLGTPPERPGTLVFAVSPDRQQAWFTATVLTHSTDRQATWLTRQGQPFVIAAQLQSKS